MTLEFPKERCKMLAEKIRQHFIDKFDNADDIPTVEFIEQCLKNVPTSRIEAAIEIYSGTPIKDVEAKYGIKVYPSKDGLSHNYYRNHFHTILIADGTTCPYAIEGYILDNWRQEVNYVVLSELGYKEFVKEFKDKDEPQKIAGDNIWYVGGEPDGENFDIYPVGFSAYEKYHITKASSDTLNPDEVRYLMKHFDLSVYVTYHNHSKYVEYFVKVTSLQDLKDLGNYFGHSLILAGDSIEVYDSYIE